MPRYGEAKVTSKTQQIIAWEAQRIAQKSDVTSFAALQTTIGKLMPTEAVQWKAIANLNYLLGQHERDWPKYVDAALAYGRQYAAQDSRTLYEAAVYLNGFVDDKLLLKKADQIIRQAIAVDNSYFNLLIRAQLLHKLGDNSQATAVAKQAIAVANKTNEHTEEAVELLASLAPPTSKAK